MSYKLHKAAFGGSHERENAVTVHQKSMDRVRELVPNGRLLEWEVRDGWGPLCHFLGKKQPEGAFPRLNGGAEFAKMKKDFGRDLLTRAARRAGLWLTALGVVGTGFWWAKKG